LTTIRISIYTNRIWIVEIRLKMQDYREELQKNSHTQIGDKSPITQEVLQDVVVEIKFLATSWLDDFEKEMFEGKTIDELLNQRSYD